MQSEPKGEPAGPRRQSGAPQNKTRGTTRDLQAALGGDRSALNSLFERLDPFLRGEARRLLGPERFAAEGEDLLQQVRLSVMRALDGVQARDGSSLRAWLKTIVRTRHLDLLKSSRAERRGGKRPAAGLTAALGIPAPGPSPSGEFLRKEESEQIRRAIEATPEQYRAVLRFILENDPDPAEVAQFLGKEAEAARKFVSRALNRLKQALKGGGPTRR